MIREVAPKADLVRVRSTFGFPNSIIFTFVLSLLHAILSRLVKHLVDLLLLLFERLTTSTLTSARELRRARSRDKRSCTVRKRVDVLYLLQSHDHVVNNGVHVTHYYNFCSAEEQTRTPPPQPRGAAPFRESITRVLMSVRYVTSDTAAAYNIQDIP